MARITFQTKLFLAALSAAIIALVVAGGLFAATMQDQTNERIESTLIAEARLAAELLGRANAPFASVAGGAGDEVAALDAEADRVGALLGARITFIARDGRVLGDSAEPLPAVLALENHGSRPEVVAARAGGLGVARRHSDTVKFDMLYVAAAVAHPQIAFVRVALPLTDVAQQVRAILTATITALGLALLGAAAIAFIVAGRIGQRVGAIAYIASRYREGDLTPPRFDYGEDELGSVARALDDSVHDLGRRLDEIARERARMEAILAGMVEGVLVVDPHGRVQLANRAARSLLKLRDEGLNRHYSESIHDPAIADVLARALGGALPDAIEFSPPQDPSRALIVRAAPATAGGAYGAVLVVHDITELRRADKIRRDFVANVSHELRTPLTAIRGYVEALTEGDVSAEESRAFLDIILRHTFRMERLVKDLLRLARLDAGQEPLDLVTCDARALVQGAILELSHALDQRRQHADVVIGEGAETFQADPVKLHDALRNLVANASTYAPEGSTIGIEVACRDGHPVIAVSDQGPGIPESDLTRVFERFYRVDKSRARDVGGTGLGLAIVKHLIELHGGHVRAENRQEGGARFTIDLPAAAASSAGAGQVQR